MEKTEFDSLRDLQGKSIQGDIVLKRSASRRPLLSAKVPIVNSADVDAYLHIELNEETGAKTLNVFVTGTGPICRLEVDARPHKEAGRSHKQALATRDCPSENLKRNVTDRPELEGNDLLVVFEGFCRMANIHHNGNLRIPQS